MIDFFLLAALFRWIWENCLPYREEGQDAYALQIERRERLLRFYAKYNTSIKPRHIDETLSEWARNEHGMYEMLTAKYGPEPSRYRERFVRFYQKYNRDKLGGVDAALSTYVGQEEGLMELLVKHYGPEP